MGSDMLRSPMALAQIQSSASVRQICFDNKKCRIGQTKMPFAFHSSSRHRSTAGRQETYARSCHRSLQSTPASTVSRRSNLFWLPSYSKAWHSTLLFSGRSTALAATTTHSRLDLPTPSTISSPWPPQPRGCSDRNLHTHSCHGAPAVPVNLKTGPSGAVGKFYGPRKDSNASVS